MSILNYSLFIRFEDKDFQEMDVEQIRASTPLRKLSPTPLDRHRSREPSPFIMPKLKLGSGTITPGGSKPADPHTFFSRSSSSQSLHQGGTGAGTQLDFDSFRAAMEAKQAEDDSLPQKTVPQNAISHSMRNLSWKGTSSVSAKQESNELCPEGIFSMERPSSAMSEMSIDLPSRAESRMDHGPLGDAISQGNLNIHSNYSSRRGSEQHSFGIKDVDSQFVTSWLEKTNQGNDVSDESNIKTPVQQFVPTPKASAKSLQRDITDLEAEIKSESKHSQVEEKSIEIEMPQKSEPQNFETKILDESQHVQTTQKNEDQSPKKETPKKGNDEDHQALAKKSWKKPQSPNKEKQVEDTETKKTKAEETPKPSQPKWKKPQCNMEEASAVQKENTTEKVAPTAGSEDDSKTASWKRPKSRIEDKIEKSEKDEDCNIVQSKDLDPYTERAKSRKADEETQKEEVPIPSWKRPKNNNNGSEEKETVKEQANISSRPKSRTEALKEIAKSEEKEESNVAKDPSRPNSRSGQGRAEREKSKDKEVLDSKDNSRPKRSAEELQPKVDEEPEGSKHSHPPKSRSRDSSRPESRKDVLNEREKEVSEERPKSRETEKVSSWKRPKSRGEDANISEPKEESLKQSIKTEHKSEDIGKKQQKWRRPSSRNEDVEKVASSERTLSPIQTKHEEEPKDSNFEALLRKDSEPSNISIENTNPTHLTRTKKLVDDNALRPNSSTEEKSKEQQRELSLERSRNKPIDEVEFQQYLSRPSSREGDKKEASRIDAGEIRPKSRSDKSGERINSPETIKDMRSSTSSPHQKEREMLEEIIAEGEAAQSKRRRTFSRSSSGFEQTEPAEWVQGENDDDELMIILDTDNYIIQEEDENEESKKPITMMTVNDEAIEELEIQYAKETGRISRPLSPEERPPSILKGSSRDPSNEGAEVKSRPGSRNSFKDNSMDRKKISFDDDFQPDVDKTTSRPGSRTSVGSGKGRHESERKKSSSLVPELETLEIPSGLKERLDKMEKLETPVKSERKDSPRPPSRPSSTGFSHLDEFERKLAEMEDELNYDEDTKDTEERPLSRGSNMWNLVDEELAKEKTYDGHFINKDRELDAVDHSIVLADNLTEEELRSKKVSFANADERYEIEREGQVKTLGKNLYSLSPPKPMKKLPGKEISSENLTQQIDSKENVNQETIPDLEPTKGGFFSSFRSRSKTPDTEKESGSFFGSLLRKGRKGSRSASRQSSLDRESQDVGSDLEGRASRASDAGSQDSLVMRIKKMGKKKPKQVSETDFDELFARGRARSEMLESQEDNKPKEAKKKMFRDESIDYNEKVQAFLEDQEKSAQKYRAKKEAEKLKLANVVSDVKKEPEVVLPPIVAPPPERKVSSYAKPEDIKLSPVIPKRDIFTGRPLPQNPDEEFLARISDFVTNYSQAPNYEQVWPSTPTPKAERRSRKKTNSKTSVSSSLRISKQSLSKEVNRNSDVGVDIASYDERNFSDSNKSDFSSQGNKIEKLGNEGLVFEAKPPETLELEFLEKVSSFVTQYCDDEDYSQKMWPQKETSKGDPKKKTMSTGKSYIEHKGEAEWFARSIEADSYEAQKQINELEKRKRQDDISKKSRSAESSARRPHLSSTSSTDRHEFQSKSKYSRISSSQPPPEISPKARLGSSHSQTQLSSQEFYTKLVLGLKKYTTPEPESRHNLSGSKNDTLKTHSDTICKPSKIQIIKQETSTTIPKRFLDQSEPSQDFNSSPIRDLKTQDDRNEEFYSKLVTGLKEITNSEEASKEMQEPDIYKKYSHHLGRAEFGSLKRKESTSSNRSNLRHSNSLSRPGKGRISRQDSGEKYVRGQSRMSDTSETMPDLEVDEEIDPVMVARMDLKEKNQSGKMNIFSANMYHCLITI